MTREDKQLLLKDLCARLPYGVKVYNEPYTFDLDNFEFSSTISKTIIEIIKEGWKPYLRPMSSMTAEEMGNLEKYLGKEYDFRFTETESFIYIDWLNSHHFDYRGLIERGLALPAPEGMYDKFNYIISLA